MEGKNSDPFTHYNYFHKIEWVNKLCTKFEITDSSFKEFSSFRKLLSRFLNRVILYQLWGSLIIYSVYNLIKNYFSLNIPNEFDFIISGVFPVISFILIIGIFSNIWEFIIAIFRFFLGKVELHKRIKSRYKTIVPYFLYILFAPLFFLFMIFIETFARFFVTVIFYLYFGAKLFFENIWLTIYLVFFTFKLLFSNISFNNENYSDVKKENFIKKIYEFNLKSK